MRTALIYTTMVLFCGMTQAQQAPAPPPILRIYVERVKPGKGPAHERSEAAFAHVLSKASIPAHYIALTAMSGPSEVWYLEEHSSFAEVESSEKAEDAPAIKPELDQAGATDGEYVAGENSMIAVYRPDLSYNADQGVAGLPKSRYIALGTIRLKPGSDQKLANVVRDMINIYSNVQITQPVVAYQVISGASGDTFLILEPFVTLAEWDKYPERMKAIHDTAGKKFDAAMAAMNDIVTFRESRLMSISPKMSYVSKQFASADADFWMPKPAAPAPAARPRPRPAAKATGQ